MTSSFLVIVPVLSTAKNIRCLEWTKLSYHRSEKHAV